MPPSNQFSPPINFHDKLILFDGVCKLCNASSRFILRFDRAQVFKLCQMQSKTGRAILAQFGFSERDLRTVIYVHQSEAYVKSDAVIAILRQMSWPWKLAGLLKVVPRPIRDWLYDRIALNRYKIFGKYETCLLPQPEFEDRFI